jgi:hypothetical protein
MKSDTIVAAIATTYAFSPLNVLGRGDVLPEREARSAPTRSLGDSLRPHRGSHPQWFLHKRCHNQGEDQNERDQREAKRDGVQGVAGSVDGGKNFSKNTPCLY